MYRTFQPLESRAEYVLVNPWIERFVSSCSSTICREKKGERVKAGGKVRRDQLQQLSTSS